MFYLYYKWFYSHKFQLIFTLSEDSLSDTELDTDAVALNKTLFPNFSGSQVFH